MFVTKFIFTICVFYIGDYQIFNLLNRYIFNNKTDPGLMTKQHWFLGNIVSYTMLGLLYFGIVGNTYFDINRYSLLYTLSTIPINIFIIDTVFYFMHRASHSVFVYNNVHYFHHSFRPIHSGVSRASHWVDSNLENIAFTIPFIIVPTYFPLMFMILIFTFIWGCYIHGDILYLKNKYINDSYYHGLHHKYGQQNCNFSYYFTFWDRVFGTIREK